MPIKYTVKFTLNDPTADVSILDTKPQPTDDVRLFLDTLGTQTSRRIENNSLILDFEFFDYSKYQEYISLRNHFTTNTINWVNNNNIRVDTNLEVIA